MQRIHGLTDLKVEGMDAIYLDIHDRFFRNEPLARKYPVIIRVVYWDYGGGKWKLTYDSTSGEKTAMVIQNGNTGRWVEKTIVSRAVIITSVLQYPF